MSNEYGANHCSDGVFDGHLANDEINCSDFSDIMNWSNPGLNLLGEHLPELPGHMKDLGLTHSDASANIHDSHNGYVSELDISNAEADGIPNQPSDNDTINMNDPETLATFTSLVLFANNPSAQRIELQACDYSHQATIQALAMKLNLHCSPSVSSTTVYLRKFSHEETIAGLGRQINSTVGVSSNPVSTRFESLMRGNTNSQLSQTNETYNSFATHAPASIQELGKNQGLDSMNHNASLGDGISSAFTKDSILEGIEYTPLLSPTIEPPLPPPRYRPSSDHDSILSMPTSVESYSRRELFPALSRTLKAIGACWRCKILRKKMNPAKPAHEPKTNLGGKTSAASESYAAALAIECLRNCVDMLRLHEPGYLTPALHAKCDPQQCRVEGFKDLNASINAFIEEFSEVIFRKENRANERKWWLSAFYGLYIQSFVRRAIAFVEDQSLAYFRDSHPELRRTCSDYLNLAAELFEAASASYDPLMSVWSLEKEPIDYKFDLRLIKYYRLAQAAVKTDLWAQKNVQSSFEFIALAFGQDVSSIRHQKNKPDIFSSLPVRSALRRSSIESQTRRFSGGIAAESIYEDESSRRVSSPAIDASLLQKFNGKVPGRLRRSSGAKRRASSPPQSDNSLRRNDSSSSMLNVTAMRRRGLSLATQNSPLSSPYLVAYDSTTSPRWNGSEDSLANLPQLLSPDSPAPRESQEFASSVSLRTPSLHNMSSNESFLEIPGLLNRKRSRSNLARGKLSQKTLSCECCPKKPKVFDSAEALSAHEREKQYECTYCGNRFKTKNEAERHQNSLHIRRQSWSCSKLLDAGYMHAFRRSLDQDADEATCCYCGIRITEPSARNDGDVPGEEVWDARLQHLKNAHKFGECITSKQFYRADHFRQHLKHSHAAIVGDGTSHLETICLTELALPAM